MLALSTGMLTASADQSPKANRTVKKAAKKTVKKAAAATSKKPKVKVLTFGEGSDIDGGVVTPDGDQVDVRGNVTYSSLIRVRNHFVAEIFKSAEDL